MFELTAATVTRGALALALIVAGAYLVHRGRTMKSVWILGCVAVLYGARYSMVLLERGTPADTFLGVVHGVLAAAAGLALIWLVLVAPRPVQRADVPAIAISGAYAIVMVIGQVVVHQGIPQFATGSFDGVISPLGGNLVLHPAETFTLILLALRYGNLARAQQRTGLEAAIMSAGMVIFATFGGRPPLIAVDNANNLFAAGGALLAASVWLWHSHTTSPPRRARYMAWFLIAVPLVSISLRVWPPDFLPLLDTFARFLALLIFGYGILKHQLLGLDVKVRWTLSKTTLAGIFVAVFFIASEAAQEFFGATLGSSYVGILAAGLLVFAIAPLSRIADRLAEKAVPVAAASPSGSASEQLGPSSPDVVYRAAVLAAMRDGVLTRREETHLADVAEGLGIGPRRALEIRVKVEEGAE